jgi:hypothetical protein
LALARETLAGLKLQLHPEKTHVAAVDDGFAFLGYLYFLHRGRSSTSGISSTPRPVRANWREPYAVVPHVRFERAGGQPVRCPLDPMPLCGVA